MAEDGNCGWRIELGIDGNCGFALLGDDLQVGEAEFVEVETPTDDCDLLNQQLIASKQALGRLRTRLGIQNRSWYFGTSHPYGD